MELRLATVRLPSNGSTWSGRFVAELQRWMLPVESEMPWGISNHQKVWITNSSHQKALVVRSLAIFLMVLGKSELIPIKLKI